MGSALRRGSQGHHRSREEIGVSREPSPCGLHRNAGEIDRAVSTVRHVLQAVRDDSGEPLFVNHGPLTNRDAFCERAGVGIPLSRVSARFNKVSRQCIEPFFDIEEQD